jgi:two-component system phosphate regulon sensor histidine kinase PhoR
LYLYTVLKELTRDAMKQPKNIVTLLLMGSSILLLLVLQVFWLRGAYQDAEESFRRETNLIFRNTIFAMHDSLIQRSIKPDMDQDSLYDGFPRRRRKFQFNDTVHTRNESGDRVYGYYNVADKTTQIEIFSSVAGEDSLKGVLRPLVRRMQMDKEPKSFIIRLGPDSLKTDSIHYYYKGALDKAGIPAAFKVLAIRMRPGSRNEKFISPVQEGMVSEIIPLNPVHHYAVAFADTRNLLLKEMTPEILFSAFLTLLTIGSFYIMYRNLRAQQKLMQIKNDFISNITHELKTPVATVSVALEALKNFNALENPQRTTEYLEMAQNELNRLALMTDKILKTAVFEDQGVDIRPEKINLDNMIQQVLSSLKLVFEKRKIDVSYKKHGEDFHLYGGAAHLTTVLYNLLDNALKYSHDGASVEVNLNSGTDAITLSVKDTGIGIAPEYQKKIFEKFFRVPSGDVHTVKGYGLGLSYVASVVKSHRGEISVASEPGKGSCFSIRFNQALPSA